MSCGISCRLGSDPVLLWLWHRPAAVAWELAYAAGAVLKSKKKKKKKKNSTQTCFSKECKNCHVGSDLCLTDTGKHIVDDDNYRL